MPLNCVSKSKLLRFRPLYVMIHLLSWTRRQAIRPGMAFSRQLTLFPVVGSSRLTPRATPQNRQREHVHHYAPPYPASSFLTRRFLSKESTILDHNDDDAAVIEDFFAPMDFAEMGIRSRVLLQRLERLGWTRPTAVQAAAFDAISQVGEASMTAGSVDVMVGAETGSGKTLAYLLPLFDDILQSKEQARLESPSSGVEDETPRMSIPDLGYDYARALILVPNKELVQQVVRMATTLAGGSESLIYGASTLPDTSSLWSSDRSPERNVPQHEMVRIAIFPGGLNEPKDFPPFRASIGLGGTSPPIDIVISTPAAIGPLGLKPSNINMFADIQTLVIDEADMLLDGGYLRPLEQVLLGFRRSDRADSALSFRPTQHVFVAATLPDMGLRSVDAYLQRKFPRATRITLAGMHQARHSGLRDPTVWLEIEGKRERMQWLVDRLQTAPQDGGLQGEKVMVFLNSVEDVEAAAQALVRAGQNALPYHAKMTLEERTRTLDRFRRYASAQVATAVAASDTETTVQDEDEVPILVCTDLASRGLDVPGVNVVVQLQFAGNVVAHLHRMGRCGRAGQRIGRGLVFYGEQEREVVKVIQQAEDQQERMVLKGDVSQNDEEQVSALDSAPAIGSVKNAFSRKRGFSKKLKKIKKEEAGQRNE